MEPRMVYEHLMRDAFNCERFEYPFVNADYCDYREEHSSEYPIYVECALIVLLKYKGRNEGELKSAIKKIEEAPTIENTDDVLEDLYNKHILF